MNNVKDLWRKLLILDEIEHQKHIGANPLYVKELKLLSRAYTLRKIPLKSDGSLDLQAFKKKYNLQFIDSMDWLPQ